MSRPVVLIDVANIFIRCYQAYPQMSPITGEHIGGAVGFLKMLGKICRDVKPSRVYCAWEGGGSARRRSIFPEYKLGRRPEKLNRFYGDDIPESEQNIEHQRLLLLKLLKKLPVCQLYVGDCEADDLIAHLVNGPLRTTKKIIMSADKDFYQLFDDNTWCYSPQKKLYVTKEDVFKEMRVTCSNIAVTKAMCGDASDNIPGIKGMGFKIAAKRFPMLSKEQPVMLSEIIDYANAHRDEAKVYQAVVDNEAVLRRNYRLVQLAGGMVSHSQQSLIDKKVLNYVPKIDRIGLIALFREEGINDIDAFDYVQNFDSIILTK